MMKNTNPTKPKRDFDKKETSFPFLHFEKEEVKELFKNVRPSNRKRDPNQPGELSLLVREFNKKLLNKKNLSKKNLSKP